MTTTSANEHFSHPSMVLPTYQHPKTKQKHTKHSVLVTRTLLELTLLFGLSICILYSLYDLIGTTESPQRRQLQESQDVTESSSLAVDSRVNLQQAPVNHREVDILVMYVFSNTDKQYYDNLVYFVEHGIKEGDGVEYVIVIQKGEKSKELQKPLPELPSNAWYEQHTNRCYDWGTFGWLINTSKVDVNKYKYFVFMNSSVRGPFMPVYFQNQGRWIDIFINKINDDVKLTGSTISCEGAPKTDTFREWRRHPHVQSYVVATDKIGLQVLIEDGMVFACHDDMRSAVYYSELGASRAILVAGYNLDCLMVRYQNIDWRDQKNWECNMRINPYNEHYYDGVSMHPFEVVFVKMKDHLLKQRQETCFETDKYSSWFNQLQKGGVCEINSNQWKIDSGYWKVPRVLFTQKRGSECFDHAYYLQQNADIPQMLSKEQAFKHYVDFGQFEGRAHNFTCEFNMQGLYVPF